MIDRKEIQKKKKNVPTTSDTETLLGQDPGIGLREPEVEKG